MSVVYRLHLNDSYLDVSAEPERYDTTTGGKFGLYCNDSGEAPKFIHNMGEMKTSVYKRAKGWRNLEPEDFGNRHKCNWFIRYEFSHWELKGTMMELARR